MEFNILNLQSAIAVQPKTAVLHSPGLSVDCISRSSDRGQITTDHSHLSADATDVTEKDKEMAIATLQLSILNSIFD